MSDPHGAASGACHPARASSRRPPPSGGDGGGPGASGAAHTHRHRMLSGRARPPPVAAPRPATRSPRSRRSGRHPGGRGPRAPACRRPRCTGGRARSGSRLPARARSRWRRRRCRDLRAGGWRRRSCRADRGAHEPCAGGPQRGSGPLGPIVARHHGRSVRAGLTRHRRVTAGEQRRGTRSAPVVVGPVVVGPVLGAPRTTAVRLGAEGDLEQVSQVARLRHGEGVELALG